MRPDPHHGAEAIIAGVRFRRFEAADVVSLRLQARQHRELGMFRPVHSIDDGRELAARGPGWTGIAEDGRVLGCAGFAWLWPECHAVAWAMLGDGIGNAHLAITRFARARIEASPIARIDAIVDAEDAHDPGWRWALAVGLRHAATLRCYGPEGRTHQLFERVI